MEAAGYCHWLLPEGHLVCCLCYHTSLHAPHAAAAAVDVHVAAGYGLPLHTMDEEEAAPWDTMDEEEAAPWDTVDEEEAAPWDTMDEEEAAPRDTMDEEEAAPWEMTQEVPWCSLFFIHCVPCRRLRATPLLVRSLKIVVQQLP